MALKPLQKSSFFKVLTALFFAVVTGTGLSACQTSGRQNELAADAAIADKETPVADEAPPAATRRRLAAQSAQPLRSAVDSLVVFKGLRELRVYRRGGLVKRYAVSLGSAPEGRKVKEGDRKTPEGHYTINDKNDRSTYHKNLGISYPNRQDRLRAQRNGVSAGSEVKLHGLPNDMRYKPEEYLNSDWTWGCIALSNEEIDELYRFVAVGTPIVIFP